MSVLPVWPEIPSYPALPPALKEIHKRLRYDHQDKKPDDTFVRLSCAMALAAAAEGNHGVGAVIVHGNRVVATGRNRAFFPRFRSDLHAEMDALNNLEQEHPKLSTADCILYSSLECCPMCTTRLINVGIGRVLYAADDDECGMVRRFSDLPAGYRELASSRNPPQQFGSADCSGWLKKAAADIFQINLETLNNRVLRRE